MNWQGNSVLVIDDELMMCELVDTVFSKEGANVICSQSAEDGLRIVYNTRPDLVILDYLMPDMNGLEVLQVIRRMSDLPVIMLTVIDDRDTMVNLLQAGADEYITKPFYTEELLARAWAVLRRAKATTQPTEMVIYDDGNLNINLETRRVSLEGKPVKLTATEFALLSYLVRRVDFACTFEQIIQNIWGDDNRSTADNVHVFIWQLRQKIEPDPKDPTYLISEHSIGYRFARREPQ